MNRRTIGAAACALIVGCFIGSPFANQYSAAQGTINSKASYPRYQVQFHELAVVVSDSSTGQCWWRTLDNNAGQRWINLGMPVQIAP